MKTKNTAIYKTMDVCFNSQVKENMQKKNKLYDLQV